MGATHFITDDNRLIIPETLLKDIQFQLMMNAASVERRRSDDAISRYLKKYFEETLPGSNEDLFRNCIIAGIGLSESSYARVIGGGKGQEDGNIKYELIDFLCYVCWTKDLIECALDEKFCDDKGKYSVLIPEYAQRKIEKLFNGIQANTNSEPVEENAQYSVNPILIEQEFNKEIFKEDFQIPYHVQLLNYDFWVKFRIDDEDEKARKISRFFTHTDSSLVCEVIANDAIVDPADLFSVKDSDGNSEEKTSTQILDLAQAQSFSLIKIVAEGGMGKTTLLFWLAYTHCTTYHFVLIDFSDDISSAEICKELQKIFDNDHKPIIFLIDNVADIDTASQLKRFVNDVKKNDLFPEIIFLVAERASRYDAQFRREDIERLFSGNIQSIEKIPVSKEIIFEKIYQWLSRNNPQIDIQEIKESSRDIFLSKSVKSVSESTFLLINILKLSNKIEYDFDWDDWENFVKSKEEYADLKYLFFIVACFYQFGIKVSVEFKSSHIRNADRLLILKAINTLGLEKSPIILQDENRFLALKHEHIATWFLRDPGNAIVTQGFFRDFLKEIDTTVSAKLLRKVRKLSRLREFRESCIGNELRPEQYLAIVDDYLKLPGITSDERKKMLNEKGMTLLALGKEESAITTFNEVIALYSDSNHARDQLAKLYVRNSKTYQLALNKYFEIYQNDGAYALIEIYKLLKKCKEENVQIEFDTNISFSEAMKKKIANECINKGEFDFAMEMLDKIEVPDLETARCYNLLAHLLKFTDESIELKWECHKKAIAIKKNLPDRQKSYQFEIDYAIFLYRIREFSKSTTQINRLCSIVTSEEAILIREIYKSKIRGLNKLFFKDLPRWEDTAALSYYLSKQCKEAAALINHKQTNIETIMKGFLILQTVRFHSRSILSDIYYGSLVQIAYCYMQHAEKGWNNFSARENRLIAEHGFDYVIRERGYLNQGDSMDMIKNLLNFKEEEKSAKALRMIERMLKDEDNKRVPIFYRFSGNAKRYLKRYEEAMQDYWRSVNFSKTYQYEDPKDFNSDMAYTFNNMVLLICDCIENGIALPNCTLEKAQQYCDRIKDYKKDFKHLHLTQERIDGLKKR